MEECRYLSSYANECYHPDNRNHVEIKDGLFGKMVVKTPAICGKCKCPLKILEEGEQ